MSTELEHGAEEDAGDGDPRARLAHLVEHATHLLPSQRPIEAFVHHNTLHAFEHLSFDDAVRAASDRLGGRPYMAESAFRAAYAAGRVLDRDLTEALERRVADEALGFGVAGLRMREVVRRWMLHLPGELGGPVLAWRLRETDFLRALPDSIPRDAAERLRGQGRLAETLDTLWSACEQLCAAQPASPPRVERPRDRLLLEQSADADLLVHPMLIRWCGAYLDHGQSYWPMPARAQGFYRAMLDMLAQAGTPLRGWVRPLRARARSLLASGTDAAGCVLGVLERWGVPAHGHEAALTATLLALPGWPGMFVQLAARPDLAPGHPPPTDLMDFLAVRLLLDEAALTAAAQDPSLAHVARPVPPAGRQAWQLYHAALLVGLHPEDARFAEAHLPRLSRLLERWSRTDRESLWQLAYERRTRVQLLDALLLQHRHRRGALRAATTTPPFAQVVCCIDDREESLRRHLEEHNPAYETLGSAGFFGVPMAWRGLTDAHPRPLCPAGLIPRHLVEERPDPAHVARWTAVRSARERSGRTEEASAVGSRTLVRGSLLSLLGAAAIIPMTARLLSPARHARWGHASREGAVPGVMTLLHDPSEPEKDGYRLGFTVQEMIGIVQGTLASMGLTQGFAPLVVFLGHGSSSLNNPHEAAHDCGACGGGRGGPNARAFAAMANHPAVRTGLRAAGIDIPPDVWFVGGYHNTADDSIDLYDLHLVPEALQARMAQVKADLDVARRWDAHERCRRFEHADLDLSIDDALRHVEDRSEDLAQPRPEYGHATNALCLVGQRAWSRGLFLDRRAFLVSYSSERDPDGRVLEGLLASVGPVGAGINLEYYFSFVDPSRYGCDTKLPHNITGLVGVMDGHGSDLRTGLPWQMVEIHEPVRLLNVIEARPERLVEILGRQPGLARLIQNRWILVVAFDPHTGEAWFFDEDGFKPHVLESEVLPERESSAAWYRGSRDFLPPAFITASHPGTGSEKRS